MSYSQIKYSQLCCLVFVCLILVVYPFTKNNSYRNIISPSTEISEDKCRWKYDHYSPSEWELSWYNNITTLQSQVCPTLMQKEEMSKSIQALQYIINLQKTLYQPSSTVANVDKLLSKMYYRLECASSSQSKSVVSQSIEPLIGLLRDPLTMCPHTEIPADVRIGGDESVQSKRFFSSRSISPISKLPNVNAHHSTMVMQTRCTKDSFRPWFVLFQWYEFCSCIYCCDWYTMVL